MPSLPALPGAIDWSHLLTGCAAVGTLWLAYTLVRLLFPTVRITRSFANLPGPPLPRNWTRLLGHQYEALTRGPAPMSEAWHDTYGPTIRLARPFGRSELSTTDPAALTFIYRSTDERFVKPEGMRAAIAANVGNGVLSVEGHTHRRHRRVLNPAFGWPQIVECVRQWAC